MRFVEFLSAKMRETVFQIWPKPCHFFNEALLFRNAYPLNSTSGFAVISYPKGKDCSVRRLVNENPGEPRHDKGNLVRGTWFFKLDQATDVPQILSRRVHVLKVHYAPKEFTNPKVSLSVNLTDNLQRGENPGVKAGFLASHIAYRNAIYASDLKPADIP